LAATQAQIMAAKGKLDHDVGAPFQERIRKSGFDAAVAVENIGAGYHTLAEAFSGWRDSPPHRANMLNASVTRMGIAAVYAPKSKYKVFWSLILATPDEHHG
ncbi:MAG: CAP domain-containing protein, partial [Xanthobacteraceae bacterium]